MNQDPPSDRDPIVEKWSTWLDGPIANEVLGLNFRRQIWRGVNEMIEANSKVGEQPSEFWEYHRDVYAVTQAIAVRRQTDTRSGVISLAKLLQDLSTAAKARRLTRELWLAQWNQTDPHMLRLAEQRWSEVSGGGGCFDHHIAGADLKQLAADGEKVKSYVDDHVAHHSAFPKVANIPTFDDLHRAIDDVGATFTKYTSIVRASAWATLEPIGTDRWRAIFRVPWLAPTPD